MRAVSVGLLVEEQRSEVAAAWRQAVERELGGEPALAFAVAPLLREMALALRGDRLPSRTDASGEATLRSAVLVRSGASPSRVAREFKLVHRALWEILRAAGRIVGADERRAADEWLDDALASMLDRLDRVRTRAVLLERGGEPTPAAAPAPHRPPPIRARPTGPARPPPLPALPATASSSPLGID